MTALKRIKNEPVKFSGNAAIENKMNVTIECSRNAPVEIRRNEPVKIRRNASPEKHKMKIESVYSPYFKSMT